MSEALEQDDIDVLSDCYRKSYNRLYKIVDWKVSLSVRRIKLEMNKYDEECRVLDKHFHLNAVAKRIYPEKTHASDNEIKIRIYPMEVEERLKDESIGFLGVSMTLNLPKDSIAQITSVIEQLNYLYVLADIPDETLGEAHIYRADFESHRDSLTDDFNFKNK